MSKNKKTEEVTVAEGCKCGGCKKPQARFTFCTEHYEWFKFGLISKAGTKVSDFDKKIDHYYAYVEKQKHYTKAA